MKKGESIISNSVLRMLGAETVNQIEYYVYTVRSREFTEMQSLEQIEYFFKDSMEDFLSCLSEEELLYLRSYTGYNFWNINAALRGNWNYETNGALTNEKLERYRKDSDIISTILRKFNGHRIDFFTFRGTTIDAFSNYGIKDLSDFETLKGKFLYEQGFTSTSILRNTSYFKKTLEDGRFCNIGIKYLLPSESSDGALLLDNNLSYSAGQNEFLLDKGALFKVIDIEIEENAAILTVVLVPKEVYDVNRNRSKKGSVKP